MFQSKEKKPLHFKRWVWGILLLIVLATLAVGGIATFGAHAASPLNGRYNLRAITTSGPKAGLYITGSMSLTVNGSGTITGTICGLRISEQRCTAITGSTPDSIHVTLTFHHIKGLPNGRFVGAYESFQGKHGVFNGFQGTFNFGTSGGTWDARVAGAAPLLTGTWNVFGKILSGHDKGKQFHGVLSLIQNPANNRMKGTYCPKNGTCTAVTGGEDVYGNFFFYIDIVALNHTLRLRGTFVEGSAARISGNFQLKETNAPGADRGYWIGHSI